MEEELFIPKTKHKGLKIMLAILLIAGLAVGGYFLYQYKFNNPKIIINKILDTAKANVNEVITQVNKKEKYQINGYAKMKIDISEKSPILDILKDLEIQFNGETDFANNISNYSINTKYKNDKLIDIKTYIEDNKAYILLDELYDKYLKIDTSESNDELNINLNPEDIRVFYNGLIDAFQKQIQNSEIQKANGTVTIDGKEIEVIDNYLELKDGEVNNFAKGIIKSLKNNEEFVALLTKLSGENGKTLLEELEEGMDEEKFQGIYNISFLTDKSFFNKKLISIKQSIIQADYKFIISTDLVSDDEILLSISSSDTSISLRVKANDSTLNMTISETIDNESIGIDIKTNFETIKEVTKPDLSKSKDINDLTQEEVDTINSKLSENKNLEKLFNEIQKSFNSEV